MVGLEQTTAGRDLQTENQSDQHQTYPFFQLHDPLLPLAKYLKKKTWRRFSEKERCSSSLLSQ